MEDETERTEQEMNLQDAISVLLGDLPKEIQDFALSPKKDEVALSLTKKYDLHVDQAGAFQRAYMLMLLGVSSPEDFVVTMRETGMAEGSINNLLSDLNEQVFVPLRKAEQSPANEPLRPGPIPSSEPAPRIVEPLLPAPSFLPAIPPVAPIVPPQPAPVASPTPVYTAPVPPAPIAEAPAYTPPVAQPEAAATVRTMATDMASAREATPIPNPFAGIAHSLKREDLVIPAHVDAIPPTPVSAPVQSVPSPDETPFRAPPPNLPGTPSSPIVKSYSTDPYREPIE